MRARLRGGLYGLLVGDALGVPYEFHPAREIPPPEQIELEPPPGFRRAHAGTPPGTWSDDGAQALALLDSLLIRGEVDLDDLGQRFLAWLNEGDYSVDAWAFDVGITTTRALRAFAAGVPAARAGPAGERDNGNGALMRVLPLALWHQGDDAALVADAQRQSLITHGHLRSQVCCALYVLWARAELRGEDDAFQRALSTLRLIYADSPARVELETRVVPAFDGPPGGTGYVVDCLRSAVWACQGRDYEEVARRAIGLGDDTDTTAAVAGGVAGIRWGEAGIPARWREGLRGRELPERLLAALLARGGPERR